MAIISKSDLAMELGVTKARVSQYVRDGLPVCADGKLDREKALKWIRDTVVSLDETKGAGRAARIVNGTERHDFRKGPPVSWLQPVHDAQNDFDKGVLFSTLFLARRIEALGAMAAHDAGASIAVSKLAGDILSVIFLEVACDFMRENDIGPFAYEHDPGIWFKPGDCDMSVDWKRVAEDEEGEPYEPKKWDAYAKAQKAKLRKAARDG